MKKNLKPKAYMYPLPVLIIGTYDEKGNPNAMNAAWGTVCDENLVSICISSGHKTMKNIKLNKQFTVAFADVKNVVPADYVGVVSGNKITNKFERTGWHHVRGEFVNAPIIQEFPLSLECELVSYDQDSEVCIGRVVNVQADENILTDKDKVDLTKFKPLCFDCDTHGYYTFGEKVGQAFSDGLKLK